MFGLFSFGVGVYLFVSICVVCGVFGCVDYGLHLFTMYIIINVVLTLFYKLNLHFVLLVCIFVS